MKTVRMLVSMMALIAQANAAGLTAKITLPDGATRVARLNGVGCSAAICSRVAIQGKAQGDAIVKTRFGSIATINSTNQGDAVLTLKDGTTQRLSLLKDFRVLYLAKPSGGTEKLDLANVQSVEFLRSAK